MEIKYVFYMIIASFIATVGQVLLKISASREWKINIREYFNIFVICGYILIFMSMFINIYAYRGVEYQGGIVLGSLSYIFIIILSNIFLKEKITRGKVVGCLAIIVGMAIYSSGI